MKTTVQAIEASQALRDTFNLVGYTVPMSDLVRDVKLHGASLALQEKQNELTSIPESLNKEDRAERVKTIESEIAFIETEINRLSTMPVVSQLEADAVEKEYDTQQLVYENDVITLFWNTYYFRDLETISDVEWNTVCVSYKDRNTLLKRAKDVYIYARKKKLFDIQLERASEHKIVYTNLDALRDAQVSINYVTAFFVSEPDTDYTDKDVNPGSAEYRTVQQSIISKHGLLNAFSIDLAFKVYNGKNRVSILTHALDDSVILTEDEQKRVFTALVKPIMLIPYNLELLGASACVGLSRAFNSKAIAFKEERSALALRIKKAYTEDHKTQLEIAELFGVSSFTVSEYININSSLPVISAMLNKAPDYLGVDLSKYDAKINNIIKLSKLFTQLGYSKDVPIPRVLEEYTLSLYTGNAVSVVPVGGNVSKTIKNLDDFVDNFKVYFGATHFTADKLNKSIEAAKPIESINSKVEACRFIVDKLLSSTQLTKELIESIFDEACEIRYQLNQKGVEEKKAMFLAKFGGKK